MKESTKKKYFYVAERFNLVFEEENFDFKVAVKKFLQDAQTRNTLRVYKAGIRYWVVGYCLFIKDKEKKKKIRKRLEEILENVTNEIKKNKKFKGRKGYRYSKRITQDKLKKIFKNEEINDRHKILIFIMLLSGCRPSEVKNLKIFKDNDKIVFEKIINKKTKKLVKKTRIYYNFEDIIKLMKKFKINKLKFERYNENTIRKIFSRIQERTKIQIRPYSCRNFFSAEMKKMLEPTEVAKALGHEKLQNQSYYGRSSKADTIFPKPVQIQANFEPKGEINPDFSQFFSPQPLLEV